jgi:MFS family permease
VTRVLWRVSQSCSDPFHPGPKTLPFFALSDRLGRKWLIAGGMWLQAAAIALIGAGTGFALWAVGAVLLGVGTAMVYPTLLAAIGDVAHPSWRTSYIANTTPSRAAE